MTIKRFTRSLRRLVVSVPLAAVGLVLAGNAQAESVCPDVSGWPSYTANVVVFDTPMVFNRLGAQNPNWIMYALRRDVVDLTSGLPEGVPGGPGTLTAGNVALRPDKRPRPIVLRVPRCSKLTISFDNLLNDMPPGPNGANPVQDLGDLDVRLEERGLECVNNNEMGGGACPQRAEGGFPYPHIVDDQVLARYAGVHVQGMMLGGPAATGIANDSSYVGNNANSCVAPGDGPTNFTLLADHDGAFKLSNPCAAVGGEASGGNNGIGMWGMVVVEPLGSRIYRSQVYEEEYRLAADADLNGVIDPAERVDPMDPDSHPKINYEATYPNQEPWISEGKAGLPILNMMNGNEIVHSEINAIVAGPNSDGTFPSSTYPLESIGIRNPTVPNRLEAFRDWASMFHDETASADAFWGFFEHPVLSHTLHGVRDSFMINYASGGIGSEIIANRLGVGPMYDCLGCAYEEFFLTSFTVGDPGMRVDVPANFGLEGITPEQVAAANLATLGPLVGPKATTALFQDDPANIHNSYTGDFAKFRNIHAGPKEQHIFHLHNHQWLFNANDDRANYLDAQGIGPGSSYTYEINYGGSGNRNKTAGDAIFHCHFYPHFAQGMWYHWRVHDVIETGTILEASLDGGLNAFYHDTPFALGNSPPALASATNTAGLTNVDLTGLPADARNRAHPDGEILAGIPIPAVVPMPGKPMAPMPGDVVVVTKDANGDMVADSSQNYVVERDKNPGYPFWIAGMDCSLQEDDPNTPEVETGMFDPNCALAIVGQRPPTPPLDMITQAQAADLLVNDPFYAAQLAADTTGKYAAAFVAAAGGFNGGLPRHSLEGCKASATGAVPGCPHVPHLIPELGGGPMADPIYVSSETRLDFHKEVKKAKGVIFPEAGTDLEKTAMAHHATREHPSTAINLNGTTSAGVFVQNGLPPVPGAPYNDPCVSDTGQPLLAGMGAVDFFSATGFFDGSSGIDGDRDWDSPFTYAAANIQIDAVFNKAGYHYPQQRILALWGDVMATINKDRAPEPFVMRLNTFNCAKYQHSNLVPKEFEVDDYQVRTPTDIIGQHIHLPKWDLTTADGAANGWNYEDGTLSPGMVQERIEAINRFSDLADDGTLNGSAEELHALAHPALGAGVGGEWLGGRVTLQRWFVDPVVDRDGIDRGLGIVFTHDHYGPSTHQQIGLYSTLLAEPAESTWRHNETGVQLGTRQAGCGDPSLGCDGGPTSWQAAIIPGGWSDSPTQAQEPFREFYFEFSDFQHAYEAGVYVGAGPDGRPFVGAPGPGQHGGNGVNTAYPVTDQSFRNAINPSFRQQAICKGANCPAAGQTVNGSNSPFPDIVRYPDVCPGSGAPGVGVVPRPCPEAISADDIGMFVANYRNEPVGLRVFDPDKMGPDNNPGTQADGLAGDLAFALQSRTDRECTAMNAQPGAGAVAVPCVPIFPTGTQLPTTFPDSEGGAVPYQVQSSLYPGDPFMPMMRTVEGDLVKVKIQAGGQEHEHNATIHGIKWQQGNSGHGPDRPTGGWRNAQNDGISEQFNFSAPVKSDPQGEPVTDHVIAWNTGQDGWWTGTWGLLRSYETADAAGTLYSIAERDLQVKNADQFEGACPNSATRRPYQILAVTANELLCATRNPDGTCATPPLGVTVTGPLPDAADALHEGGPLDPDGGTLVYNPRATNIPANTIGQDRVRNGPLHDPTAILYVRLDDVEKVDPTSNACRDRGNSDGRANPFCPIKLKNDAPIEPVVLRANAGECLQVTLYNRVLHDVDGDGEITGDELKVGDLAGFNTLLQMVVRDRQAEPGNLMGEVSSVTTFNNNLIRPSSYVGLHPQLVEFDVSKHDGVMAGINGFDPATNTITQLQLAEFEGQVTYLWYAGDLAVKDASGCKGGGKNKRCVELVPTPVEYGGSNLTPADKIKQGQKGLIGALVIEPELATWNDGLAALEQVPNRQDGGASTRGTRADLTIALDGGGDFEDLVLMKQSGMNHRLNDGEAVPNIASEGQGIPEDSHDAGQKGANYGTEPAWFRYGIQPDADFGNAGAPAGETLGSVDVSTMFSNALTGGADPWTPVFTASPGQFAFLRLLNPTGVGRGSTFDLHGHTWSRDPYLPEDPTCITATSGLGDGTPIAAGGSGCGLPAVSIGKNPVDWYLGGQESWTPMAHFDIVVPAGGLLGVTGDYLFRDHASFGVTDGIWGIMRVE